MTWRGAFISTGILALGLVAVQWIDWPAVPMAWAALSAEIAVIQRAFHQDLLTAMRAVEASGWTAGGSLIGLSFLYGLLHAAGPGHGKAVIGTYLASHPDALRRGLALAWCAAFVQAATAIILVVGAVWLAGGVVGQSRAVAGSVEKIGYGLLILVGVWLAARALLSLRRIVLERTTGHRSGAHDHSHGHDHGPGDACSACGHAHSPSADQIAKPVGWRTALGIVLAIGLRPCTGALIVLGVAVALDLLWAGVLATLAMAVGTALAISVLALLAMGSRGLALRLAGAAPGRLAVIAQGAALTGGIVLVLIGASLLSASFRPAHPLM